MHALVFHPGGPRLEQRERPVPATAEVLLRVEYCGICGSDVHAGEPDFRDGTVMGHEFVGTVMETGAEVTGFRAGDHVVVNPNGAWCGECGECVRGAVNMCPQIWEHAIGLRGDGGLAPYTAVRASMLRLVSPDVPLMHAALIEPLAVALRTVRTSGIAVGQDAVVFGGGPIGLLVTMVLRAAGASRIVVVEPSPFRRERARLLGADLVLDPAVDSIDSALEGRRPQFAFECSGVAELVGEAVRVLRPRGTLTVTGFSRRPPFYESAELLFKEITVRGSFIYTTEFDEAIRLLESGRIDVSPLISGVYPVERADEALEALRSAPEALKILVSDHHAAATHP